MKQCERSQTARHRILDEAEHLIHLRGYNCTSLDDIARRCRMTKANLLHHFRSKEDLGLAVLDYKISAYRRCCLDPLFSEDADPVRAVSALFSEAGRFYRENGCKAGCFIANTALEMSDANHRFREKAAEFFEEWTSRLGALLRRLQTAGLYASDFEPRSRAEAILSLYEGAILLARTRRDPKVFERTGRMALEMLRPQERTKDSTKIQVALNSTKGG